MWWLFLACISKDPVKRPYQQESSPDSTLQHSESVAQEHSQDSGSCLGQSPTIAIGNGQKTLEPLLNPGDKVVMAHGPGGGWWIWGSFQTWGLDQPVIVHTSTVNERTGTLISESELNIALQSYDAKECTGYVSGLFLYLNKNWDQDVQGCLDTPPEMYAEDPLTISMEISDLLGNTVMGSVEVIADCDTVDTYWYPDLDGDCDGDPLQPYVVSCGSPGPNYDLSNYDCNDQDPSINAYQHADICGNGIDDDCDEEIDEGVYEICGNGIDDDCNNQIDDGC